MIDINKKYRTRDGQPVRVLCTDRAASNPVVVLLGDKQRVVAYDAGGKLNGAGETGLDLIEIRPYDDLKIDDKVWAWGRPEHFAGVDARGFPTIWGGGKTSHTTPCSGRSSVAHAHFSVITP